MSARLPVTRFGPRRPAVALLRARISGASSSCQLRAAPALLCVADKLGVLGASKLVSSARAAVRNPRSYLRAAARLPLEQQAEARIASLPVVLVNGICDGMNGRRFGPLAGTSLAVYVDERPDQGGSTSVGSAVRAAL